MRAPLALQKRSPVTWLLLAILLLALAARLVPGPRTIDDSYITYRYARNILSGIGFVYNPGEHVLGTTTPLYTFLMVVSGSITGGANAPFPLLAMLINAVADSVSCLLLYRLGRRLGSPRAGIGTALVWAIAPFSVTFAFGGLETSVYILLLIGMLSAHLDNRHTLTAFLAALALLTRPDALILIGPLILDRLWTVIAKRDWFIRRFPRLQKLSTSLVPSSPKPLSASEILAFALPTAVWLIFATAYFGSPIPHSIAAKSLAYRLGPGAALMRLFQHYATPFLEHMTVPSPWVGIVLILYPILYVLGSRLALRSTWRVWPFLAYPWLYFFTFGLANPLIFRWYLTPPLPAYMLTLLIGADYALTALAAALPNQDGEPETKARKMLSPLIQTMITLVVVVLPFWMSLQDWQLQPDHGIDRPAPSMAWYKLELLYRQAADLLAPEIEQQKLLSGKAPVLAAGDVGVLGYYTSANILDTLGLNSPQSTRYYPLDLSFYVGNYAVAPDLILDMQPDYIVILEVYGRAGLLKDPRFWQFYDLRQKIPTDIYGSDGILILQHKPR